MDLNFRALTMIDTVTNLLEIKLIPNKTAQVVANAFENTWLARYPKPTKVVMDHGPEFVGHAFTHMLANNGIEWTFTSKRNPQSNGIIERVHQSIAHTLRTLLLLRPPQNNEDANVVMERCIATAMQATRICSSSSIQNYSPGALAFGRDMLLNIPIVTDILAISQNRQLKVNRRLLYENRKRSQHDYQVGDRIMATTDRATKVKPVYNGPYVIEQVHTNGTVTFRVGPNVRERFNIRQVKPAK